MWCSFIIHRDGARTPSPDLLQKNEHAKTLRSTHHMKLLRQWIFSLHPNSLWHWWNLPNISNRMMFYFRHILRIFPMPDSIFDHLFLMSNVSDLDEASLHLMHNVDALRAAFRYHASQKKCLSFPASVLMRLLWYIKCYAGGCKNRFVPKWY